MASQTGQSQNRCSAVSSHSLQWGHTEPLLFHLLAKLSVTSPLPIKVLRAEVGAITDADVREAAGQDAAVVGFNVGTAGKGVERLAEPVAALRPLGELGREVAETVLEVLQALGRVVRGLLLQAPDATQ